MNRRAFLKRGGVFLAGTPFLFRNVLASATAVPLERVYVAMGTTVRFLVYHENPREALAAIHAAHDVVMRVHTLMSIQEAGSELSVWNRSASREVVRFDPLTAAAIGEALTYKRSTEGRFDPTIGAAVAQRGAAPLIPQHDRFIEWDPRTGVLVRQNPRVQLDLGGSAKGWAVDRAVEVLRSRGINSALVNAGGDLFALGTPPDADAWRIGVRSPGPGDNVVAEMDLQDRAVATSGAYERDGSTIIDPRDGRPVRLSGSTTVVAPRCGMADCLSTAAFVDRDVPLPHDAHLLIARPDGNAVKVSTSAAFPYKLTLGD